MVGQDGAVVQPPTGAPQGVDVGLPVDLDFGPQAVHLLARVSREYVDDARAHGRAADQLTAPPSALRITRFAAPSASRRLLVSGALKHLALGRDLASGVTYLLDQLAQPLFDPVHLL